MKIYYLLGDYRNYASCNPDLDACKKSFIRENYTYLLSSRMDGKPWGKEWYPMIVKLETDDSSTIGDFVPSPGENIHIMNMRAINILREFMGNIEILPVQCDFGDDYFGVNTLDLIENFTNFQESEYDVFESRPFLPNGHPNVMWYTKRVLIPEKLVGYHMFKDADRPRSEVMVDDVFVDAVKRNGLKGFKFELVWED